MKMIQNEFKFIAKNKIIMISLIAIIFIPFLYSIFFLKSVWDPYGSTGNLPVAVVNNDVPTTYQGQKLSAGKDLVKELKKNDQIGWRFVSAKKAKQGLKDKEYYTVITLPKDFSANAATVLDKHPKKMQINYKTNDSLNFIAEVISEAGAKQVNAELRETVTKSYAKVMFKQVKTAGKGFTTAAKGAKKLTDGSITLSDGLNTYTAGVDKVNDGVMTMKTSVVPLSDGVKKLADGSQTLTAGLQTVNSKTGTLASGASQLNNGASQLNTGLQTYTNGVSTVGVGTSQLANKSGQLNAGVQQLASSTSQLPAGAAGLYVLNSITYQGVKEIQDNLKEQSQDLTQFSNMPKKMAQVNQTSQELRQSLPEMKQDLATLKTLNQVYQNNKEQLAQLPQLGTQLEGFSTTLTDSLTRVGNNSGSTLKDVQVISQESSKLSPSSQQALADIQAKSNNNIEMVKNIQTASAQLNVSGITSMIKQLEPMLNELSTVDLTAKINTLEQMINKSEGLLNDSDTLTGQDAQASVKNMLSSLAQLNQGIEGLSQSSAQSVAIAKQLNQSVNGINNTPTINLGEYVNSVGQADANKITNKVTSIASRSVTTPSINALVTGVQQYTNGVDQVNSGVSVLNQNNAALISGSQQLAAGTSQLNSQVPQLTSGVSQLANGSTTLNGGLVQLNSKIPTLSNGVDQLASGTNQLAANSGQLKSGAGQLADGNKTLTSGLNAGANKVNSIKLTNSTADMFAAPSELKHSNYSYVPNYGHALAPYVLSLALFVGAIVFNFAFPIRKISMTGQSSTAWFLSKIAVGGVVAVGMGIIEPALMMVAGLNVDHPAQFFLISIMFALTSMAIIMFLSMTFDNPGRFLAMILLMLQLGGSGGTFPMQITNHFYNVIHPFLPMTYSILGFRQAITSGLGNGQVGQTVLILMLFTVVALILLWFGMNHLQKIGKAGISQLDDNQKLQALEK